MLESDKDPQATIDECLNSSWRFEILRFFLRHIYFYVQLPKSDQKYYKILLIVHHKSLWFFMKLYGGFCPGGTFLPDASSYVV